MADKHKSIAEKAEESADASGNAVEIIGDACPRPEYRILSDWPDEYPLTMGVRDEPERFPDGCGPEFESAEYTVPFPPSGTPAIAYHVPGAVLRSPACSSDEIGMDD